MCATFVAQKPATTLPHIVHLPFYHRSCASCAHNRAAAQNREDWAASKCGNEINSPIQLIKFSRCRQVERHLARSHLFPILLQPAIVEWNNKRSLYDFTILLFG